MLIERGHWLELAPSSDQHVPRRVDLAGCSYRPLNSRGPDPANAGIPVVDTACHACRGNRPQSAGQVQFPAR